ncbi:hypothetical protein SAMN05444398_11583 [Roseovarius pacificus]|uniref:50S ribosomal protein L35 n=1 Tax=Roseovarius pacificus TaxID=337701 RepID=A0A1M7IHN6_9RHOB|nr:hypothetical protein [Roseovarius pacificus]GGO61115.1 hypothetical protein GCM10011315_37080 [Roseovarius pacificus]SHM40118.1 hypothetical protein SAMN05444398_11583 [Roseovarius pacificus]
MDPDLSLIIGLILIILSIPSIMAAFSEGHAPRVASVVIIAGGALIVWAMTSKPGGYSLLEIPDIFMQVVARYLT